MSPETPILSADVARLVPTVLADVCRQAQLQPVTPRRYAVVGCGNADGALPLTLASTDPDLQVWAWDPHPDAIDALRRRRDEAAISNLAVHERRELPSRIAGDQIDVITIDGLLDASTDEQRERIASFVAENLRPGGLLCITYRTTIGWQEIVPLINLMRHAAASFRGDPASVAGRVLELLERIVDATPAYVVKRPRVAAWIASLFAADLHMIEANYLRDPCRPLSHPQVAAFAERLGCQFVGNAEAGNANDTAALPGPLAALVHHAPTPVLRESYLDLALRRSHRSDLFRLGSGVR